MKKIFNILVVSLTMSLLFFTSCLKDNFELEEKFSDQIEWNPALALPIATADLTLANLAKEKQDTLEYVSEKDLGYGSSDEDKVIQFKYVIDTARIVDVMHLPIIDPYDTTVYLKPVEIGNVSFPIGFVTLRDLLQDNFSTDDYNDYVNAVASNPLLVNVDEKTAITEKKYPIGEIPESVKSFVIANFGKEVNVKDVFEYIVLKSGTITLSCTNSSGLNFYCDVVIGSYDKKGNYVEFGTFDYSGFPSWISQGGPQKQSFQADSSYLHSDFYFSFKNLRIGQAQNVQIPSLDDQGLLLNVEMTNLVAYSGKAYVPAQELRADYTQYVTFRDEDLDRKLFQVLVAKGAFHYEIESTMGIATEFIAEFPTVDSLGVTPIRKYAAMTNSKPHYSNDWLLNNCNIDLTQNPEQPYNSLPINIAYRVHTTGGMLEFGPEQYIRVDITNTDSIFFAYAEGDLGQFDQDLFHDELDFNLSDYLGDFMSVESLVLYDPKVNVNFYNPVGIGGDLELNLIGKDEKGKSVNLFEGYNNKIGVSRPSCESVQTGQSTISSILLNKNTSNIVDFVKLMPKKIDYSGMFHINTDIPAGEPIFNCVSNKGTAKLGVSIELPLNLSAKNFVLQEDVPLDMSDLGDLSMIERVRLYVNTEHQLPINATMKLSLLDTTREAGKEYLGTLDMVVLESASVDSNGKVARDSKKHTEEEITLEKGEPLLDNFLQANKLRVEVFLETAQNGSQPVIFYSYYGLKFNIAADCKFIYTSK